MRGHLRLARAESIDNNTLQGQKYFTDGVADIDKALSLDPNNILACYIKAFTLVRYKQHKQYEEAIAYFQLVLKNTVNKEEFLNKRHVHNYRLLAYMGLSTVYNRLQSFDKSLESIEEAIAIASKSGEKNSVMANCYRLRYQANYNINKKNAISDLEQIIEYMPLSFKVLSYQKICLLLELNLNDEALNLCQTMLTTLPIDDHARLTYIYCLGFKCDKMGEAMNHVDIYDERKLLEDYRQGLIGTDDLRFFYEFRCFMNIARKKFEEAHKDILSKMALDRRSDTQSSLIRAMILLLMNKQEEARVDLESYLPALHEEVFPPQPLSECWLSDDY
jgi:tetratricopeptide (TPR) repeat protein